MNIIKIAAVSNSIFIIILLLNTFFFQFISILDKLTFTIFTLLYLMILEILLLAKTHGVIFFAKSNNARLLKIMSIIKVVLNLITFAAIFYFIILLKNQEIIFSLFSITSYHQTFIYLPLFILLFTIVIAISNILYGISFLKLSKVHFSRSTALFYIIGGTSTFLIVGFPILLIANILETILLFRASE